MTKVDQSQCMYFLSTGLWLFKWIHDEIFFFVFCNSDWLLFLLLSVLPLERFTILFVLVCNQGRKWWEIKNPRADPRKKEQRGNFKTRNFMPGQLSKMNFPHFGRFSLISCWVSKVCIWLHWTGVQSDIGRGDLGCALLQVGLWLVEVWCQWDLFRSQGAAPLKATERCSVGKWM